MAPHSEELLKAFLPARLGISEARPQFVAVCLVVAHEGHDAVLDLNHGGPPRALGEGLLLGVREGGPAVGGVDMAWSGADRDPV